MNPVVLFSLIIFCGTVQVWLMLIAWSAVVPQPNVLINVVWPEWQYFVHPERDALLYHAFVAIALLAQALGIWLVRRKIYQATFLKAIKPFLAMELVWTALMLNASFKIIVYHDHPLLAQEALIVLAIGALLSKIFWPELQRWYSVFYKRILLMSFDIKADIVVCLSIILILYVPDSKAVLARMFLGDHFHHFDSFLAPAWGYHKGAVLNVDVMSEYGIGIPVVMSWFAKLTGAFSYPRLLLFLMGGTILYFILCFIFLRRWLGSFALALITVLLAIKFQIFHYTNAPFVFTYPSHTVMRYFWDMAFFLLLWEHLIHARKRYLFLSAICCGVQIYWMPTSGYCLTIAFLSYLAARVILKHYRSLIVKDIVDFIYLGIYVLIIPVTTIFLLALTQGSYLWTHEFWTNMQEFNNYFLSGFGLMPIYENFQNKEFLLGFMGVFIPVVYLGTLLVTSGFLYWEQANPEDLMVAVLSVYGLVMYHYFMGRSGSDDYYTVAIPYVFILGFWAKRGLLLLKQEKRKAALLGLFAVVIYAILTNHLFLGYPSYLNISRNPIVDPRLVLPLPDGRSYFNASVSKISEEEKLPVNSLGEKDEGIKHESDFKTDDALKSFYDEESDFSKDAELIDALTNRLEPVALLSGFEIKMLMQADRRQFFYYSPILIARPMRMRTFPNSAMYSTGHAERTLRQLQEAKPEYIFMEKIFMQAPGTKNFKDASLGMVLNYIFANYSPTMQGQYLVAFKRRQ